MQLLSGGHCLPLAVLRELCVVHHWIGIVRMLTCKKHVHVRFAMTQQMDCLAELLRGCAADRGSHHPQRCAGRGASDWRRVMPRLHARGSHFCHSARWLCEITTILGDAYCLLPAFFFCFFFIYPTLQSLKLFFLLPRVPLLVVV